MIVMIVDEYDQRAVYKRYNVVDNGPDSVLELSVRFIVVIGKYNGVFFMAVMNHTLFAHTRLYIVIATVIKHGRGLPRQSCMRPGFESR